MLDISHNAKVYLNPIIYAKELHPPLEYRIINSSGDTIHVQTHLSVRYHNGQACEIVGTVQDISKRIEEEEEREKLKGQLAQAQRLESVGRLVNSVAHDFNNLLTVILGQGEIILSKLEANNPIREEIEQIVDAGHRSALLSQQFLAFSRKQNLKEEEVNLNRILLDFKDILVRLVGKSVNISLSLEDNLCNVLADPVRLEQVIMNIAVNAKDAMQKGGKLEIVTENRHLKNEFTIIHPEIEPGDYVQLSISDTGSGIEKDILPKIFDPFFSTKSEERGTGLGLSTVYGIVKQLHGYLLVDSIINKGTTFTMLFPATDM